jgi:hypothetical protein
MVGEDQGVRVSAARAELTEASLTSRGLCNWLVDYTPAERIYCGRPANGELCSDHAQYTFVT